MNILHRDFTLVDLPSGAKKVLGCTPPVFSFAKLPKLKFSSKHSDDQRLLLSLRIKQCCYVFHFAAAPQRTRLSREQLDADEGRASPSAEPVAKETPSNSPPASPPHSPTPGSAKQPTLRERKVSDASATQAVAAAVSKDSKDAGKGGDSSPAQSPSDKNDPDNKARAAKLKALGHLLKFVDAASRQRPPGQLHVYLGEPALGALFAMIGANLFRALDPPDPLLDSVPRIGVRALALASSLGNSRC